VLKKIKQFLLYSTSLEGNFQTVKAQVMEQNRKFAIIWASFQLVYWLYCMIMSAREPDYMKCRDIYMTAFAICAVALVLAVFAAPRVSWLTAPICLAVNIALLGAGIGIAQILAPKTITIFASVILVPVFFICPPLTTFVLIILNAVIFIIGGIKTMEPEIFRWTLTNLLIFSSIGLILGYFVNKTRFERFHFTQSAVQLAESNAKLAELQTSYAYYDQMTGLQNRRAYAEKMDQFMESMPAGCCVVMADINGLKKMNDTKGHEAGDELIIGTAECLRQSFDPVDSIYRIGGDEFCVILSGRTGSVEDSLKKLENAGSRWKGKFVHGISISYGFASDKEFDDFDSMLKAADQRMYAFKRNYYMTSGNDRRLR